MASVGECDNLAEETNTCRLNAEDHKEYGQQECRPITDGMAHENPLYENVATYQQSG